MKYILFLFSTISICFVEWFCFRFKYIFYVIVITLTFHSYVNNHYIGPLHGCVLARICNHTGISICGLEKEQQDSRLFLDDCDMFEYNCDNRKAYSKVDDKFCPQNETEDTDKNMTTSSTVSHITSETTKKTKKSTTASLISTDLNVTRIPIASECTRTRKTDSSTEVTITKNSKTTSSEFERCTCTDTEKTKTTEILSTSTESESELSTLPISTTTQTVSTLSPPDIPTSPNITDFSTIPMTKTTQTQSTNTSTSTGKWCTCNSPDLPTTKTISTTSITTPVITTTSETQSISPKMCTCLETTTSAFTTTGSTSPATNLPSSESSPIDTSSTVSSTIISLSTEPGCTCTYPHSTSSLVDDTTTTLTYDEEEVSLTTVDYEVISTPENDSCDKFPKHCKRPQTWETTVKGERRDFFQILREKFGDRIKILKDTTHFPRRSLKTDENEIDAFHFGNHNET